MLMMETIVLTDSIYLLFIQIFPMAFFLKNTFIFFHLFTGKRYRLLANLTGLDT